MKEKQMANEGQVQQQDTNGSAAQPERASTALATTPAAADMLSPFSAGAAFENAQRMAKALASSSLVPQVYRGDIANCLIAMELASRVQVSVLMVMQNLDIIQGKPSWSSKFLIATVNASGRFTPIRYEWAGEPGKESWACRAHSKDKSSGEVCVGTWITWLMATKEGWTKKNGSKWLTMPEQMFQYRAAAFWTRTYCPEISMGFHTSDELEDMYGKAGEAAPELPGQLAPGGAKSLEAVLGMQNKAVEATIDAEWTDEHGEVHQGHPPAAATKAEKPGKGEQQKLGTEK